MQQAAGPEPEGQQLGELRLDDASLVVALLVPWVGKEQLHPVQAGVRQVPAQHLHGVLAQHPHIFQAQLVEPQQQVADPGAVHLDAEPVALRVALGQFQQGLAVAEADLQGDRAGVAEAGRQVERLPVRRTQAEALPGAGEGAALGFGDAALAQHEAADRPPLGGVIERGLHRGQKNRPSRGEEAEAKRLGAMRPAR